MNATKKLLVYNASAGSGKTFTLVREYLKLALKGENPLYFRKILAITFTRKAAAEMKERVISTLSSLAADAGQKNYDPTLLSYYSDYLNLDPVIIQSRSSSVLKNILHNYADLSISTIDRFTQKLIRSFSKDLNISNDFEVILEHDEIVREAIDRLLTEVGIDQQLSKTLIDFLKSLLSEERSWKIEDELFKFSKTLFEESSIPYVDELKKLEQKDFDFVTKEIGQKFFAVKSEISNAAKKAVEIISKNNLSAENFIYGKTGPINVFYKLKESKGDLNVLGSSNKRFFDFQDEKAWYSKKTDPELKSRIDAVVPMLLPLQNAIAEQMQSSTFYYLSAINSQLYSLSLLFKVEKKLEEIKAERDILFIDDFNRIISDIVLNEPAPFIYEKSGEWYDHILIDEFQDTSVLQWQNFIPLIENALSNGTQCLLVGDGKQAIYRFRNGEVEQLAILPRIFGADSNELLAEKEFLFSENFESLHLETNYRSQKAIVDFNNLFFSNFYQEFSHPLRSVYFRNEQQNLSTKPEGYVEWFNVPIDNTKDKIPEQLKYTLSTIQDCLSSGFKLKDITCLVRTNGEGSLLAQFLTANNIDIVSSDSLLIQSSLEVRFLFALITYLENRESEELKGKIIEYYLRLQTREDETLNKIDEHRKDKKINLYQFFKSEGKPFYADDFSKLPLYQLAENLVEHFACRKNDVYINAFFEEIFQFSLKGNSRPDFIEYWNLNGYNKSVKIAQQSNAVQIMTIHKSKGLQFPVVIIPFADWDMTKKTKRKVWIDIENLNLPIKHITVANSKNLLEKLELVELHDDEEGRTLLDHMNLLYVAFTRPEERLYFCTSDCTGKRINNEIKKFATPLFELINDDGAVYSGDKNNYIGKESSYEEQFELSTHFSPNWRDRIRISYEATKAWSDNERFESARYGNWIHLLLGKINSESEIDEAILDLKIQEGLEEKQVQKLKSDMTRIFSNSFVQSIFSADQVKTESEIIDEEGRINRPDRLVFKGESVQVIDFKTGEPKEFHLDQINRYAELLTKMEYKKVEKYLFYTQNCEVQEIS